ncbi:MAG: amidohydrolase family protein [Candidatus Aminicenantales bacterium]
MEKKITRRDFLKNTSKAAALAGLGSCGLLLKGCTKGKDFDLIIKNGLIYDGSGRREFKADIGIRNAFIEAVGKLPASRGIKVIEAKNFALCPGFIDAHNHTDIGLLVNPKAESMVRQGVTTLVSGNCGSSPFPIAEEVFEESKESVKKAYNIDLDWRDIKGFFARLKEGGMALNYSTLVGHGDIRGAAMGFNDRPPEEKELEKMKQLAAQSMEGGAIGISTGLEYAPGSYAKPEEIAELCRIAAQFNGVYATHMRSEGDKLIEALDESIEVARRTGISLQISHFKVAYPRNWHKIDEAIQKIENAEREGIQIFCDRYPYIAGSTGLSYYFPLWARQGTTQEFINRLKNPALDAKLRAHVAEQEEKLGSWDKVVISSVFTEKNKWVEGLSVLRASEKAGEKPYDFMRDLLIEEENMVGMVTFMMSEENLKKILAHRLVGIGSDASAIAPYGLLGRGKPHPRHYGTFPRVLGKYVREEKVVSMPEMIRKMTSRMAEKFGFPRRGLIKRKYYADITLFNPETVIDKATWAQPHQYPEGIEYVIVNGKVVVENETHTGNLPGKILTGSKKI